MKRSKRHIVTKCFCPAMIIILRPTFGVSSLQARASYSMFHSTVFVFGSLLSWAFLARALPNTPAIRCRIKHNKRRKKLMNPNRNMLKANLFDSNITSMIWTFKNQIILLNFIFLLSRGLQFDNWSFDFHLITKALVCRTLLIVGSSIVMLSTAR